MESSARKSERAQPQGCAAIRAVQFHKDLTDKTRTRRGEKLLIKRTEEEQAPSCHLTVGDLDDGLRRHPICARALEANAPICGNCPSSAKR